MSTWYNVIAVEYIAPHDRNVRRDLGDLDELAARIDAVLLQVTP